MRARPFLSFRSLVFTSATLTALGCNAAHVDSDTTGAALIGGFDAKHPSFDAIGALVVIANDGTLTPVCTATLVSPTVVVTSKVCALLHAPGNTLGFAVGYDVAAPRSVVPIRTTEWERGRVGGGLMGVGSDIAVGRLAEPITDVVPIPVDGASESDVGQKLLTVGYGMSQTAPIPGEGPFLAGARKAGTLTVRGREGRYWELRYGSYDAFKSSLASALSASEDEVEPYARELWSETLLPDYDLVAGGDPDEVTACDGDEGGPLLRTNGNGWSVVGVFSGFHSFEPVSYYCLDPFAVYSTFGPEARHLVAAADACSGTTARGTCEGGKAIRCSREDEGPIHVTRSDCAGAGLVCSATPNEPVCAPACRSDADCTSLAPGGSCTVATGECVWAPTCTDEGTARACRLCCSGHGEGEPCFDACDTLPGAPPSNEKLRGISH